MVRPIVLALVAVTVAGCSSETSPPEAGGDRVVFAGGEAVLQVEIADTPTSRARGLMGVESLPADQGMAFVWGTIDDGAFWMKDTLIPLSIAFVGDDGVINTILEMEPCETEPCRTYEARAPYRMAVEANAGWFAEHGIEVGDTAELERHDG